MSHDDPTIPMFGAPQSPTWPPRQTWGNARLPVLRRPAPWGCGMALALVATFLAGAALSAALTAALVAPRPVPPATSSRATAALKLTLTDNFLNEGLNASDAGGLLTQIQSHIQPNGQLTISGSLRGTPVGSGQQATFVLAPSVSRGRISVLAISGSVGDLPIPPVALDRLAAAVNQQLAQSSAIPIGGGQQLTAQTITFADGEMTISYA